MIIVSQDKTEIINFDNVININITDCGEDGYLISAGFVVGRDDNHRDLGYYETEERAKEILQGVSNAYEKAGNITFETSDDERLMRLVHNSSVFEMPEK